MRFSRGALLLAATLLACAHAPPREAALVSADGAAFDLPQETATHDAVVLVFWATKCPCVARYQERLDVLSLRWPLERVRVLAVSSNADDDPAWVREAWKQRSTGAATLVVDPNGALAAQVGARSTPTAVVLDRTGAVRYRGWIDNERLPGDASREPWLEEAVDALLSGTAPSLTQKPVWGCTITRSLGEARECHPAPAVAN